MKRLIISLFLSGLFMSGYAVTITVERYSEQPDKQSHVNAIVFSPNAIRCYLEDGTNREIQNVRTILMADSNFTAVDNIEAVSNVKVYPNPTASALIIDGTIGTGTMSIYSLNGALILSQSIHEGVNTINVSNLSNGLYLLKLPNDTFKFTKE